mgnify:CR=1 FL=1
MLGSCSKDDTEVAPVEGTKDVAFKATMALGNDTRISMDVDDSGNVNYVWDFGDMVGATVKGLDVVAPFTNVAKSGPTAEFSALNEASVNYIGTENVYLVYPYKEGKTVDNDGNVEMTIPATQTYRDNSFAQMVSPAVSFAEEFVVNDDNTVKEYTFKPVASYIRVPVYGVGTIKSLTMQIKNGRTAVKIAGSAKVDVDSETPELVLAGGTDKITLDMGKGGLKLQYTEPKWVVFVIPANVAVKADTKFEFVATFDDGATSTYTITIPSTYTGTSLAVNRSLKLSVGAYFGMEDKVLIENNADLLEYLYTVSKGTDGDKTAVLVNDINFSRYDARNDINGAEGNMLAALTEYLTNGSAINSIAEGAKIDGNDHIISNLQVSGNGIFAGKPDALKNLTLSAVTVNVPDGQKTPALFAGVLPGATAVSNVKFAGGFLKNVADGVVPAMVASANATILPTADQIKIYPYPRVNETTASAYYAATLYVNGDIVARDADKKDYFGTTSRFAVIKGTKAGAVISMVSAGKAVENIIAAVDPKSAQAFSVIDTKSTSYWTGLVAAAGDGEVNTAEELAYYVKNGGTATLAANIDLQGIDLQGEQGKEWVLDNGSAPLNITGNGKYTISNALVKSQKVTESYVAYSLLGNVVNAKDIVVDGVTIDVDNVEGSTAQLYVGGIGYQGSANGVKVSNLTIDIAEDVEVSTYNEVGGLISAPTAASEKNAVTNLSINVNGNETVGLVGGMFAKAPESFNENSLAYKAEAADKYAMIAAWTLSNNAVVSKCNADVAIVGDVNFAPTDAGQIISLTYSECSEPFCDYLVNTMGHNIAVDINKKSRILTPGENPFENEE